MSDIVTETSGNVLRVELNRPARKNALTAAMYTTLAGIFASAARDDQVRAVLWHGAGDVFCAGNDIEDFLQNPPSAGDSPQAGLMRALMDLDKPLVAAVHGAAIGGGATMLTHCDVVLAAENTRFQLPFVDLALVPEFGSSYTIPARLGYLRAAELILLGLPFDAKRAAECGLVTQVVPGLPPSLLGSAMETAQKLAAKPPAALRACKKLMKRSSLENLKSAINAENEEFSSRVRSAEVREALAAFLRKRPASPHLSPSGNSTELSGRNAHVPANA
jgi:enoyl-CoA hydratase/carnithine racemase